MKKFAAILTAMIIGSVILSAEGVPGPDYVKTKDGTYFFKNVRNGLGKYIVAKNPSGDKKKFRYQEIETYQSKGVVYERCPKIINGELSSETCFMELKAYRNGIKLYKQEKVSKRGRLVEEYHLFKGQDYLLSLDEKNRDYIMDFFFPKSRK